MTLARRSLLAGAAALAASPVLGADMRVRGLRFEDLPGWAGDDLDAARAVFLKSVDRAHRPGRMTHGQWARLVEDMRAGPARAAFERAFRPVEISTGAAPLFTGYYEPELKVSDVKRGPFVHPIYRLPPERVGRSEPWLTRAEIDAGALDGRRLEIAWSDDPVEVFFLHIQGSGRLRFPNGRVMRVGYAGKNGHAYTSVGREMARDGVFALEQASAQRISEYVRVYPSYGMAYLQRNRSYVFFREISELRSTDGPIGAAGVPLEPLRSVAVDPDVTPLGLPVWVETEILTGPLARLMVAQDTGAAIKGGQRADIFFGSGDAAGQIASAQKSGGRLVTLMPRALPLVLNRG